MQRRARVAAHGFEHVGHLESDGFERRAGDVSVAGVAAQADQKPCRVRVPVRRAQTHKRRHKDHAVGVGHARGQGLDIGRCADKFQVVAQPLHHRAGDKDAALERVLEALLCARRHGGNQPGPRAHELGADVFKQEAARAVGVLGFARAPAQLAEERGLLVAGNAGNGYAGKTRNGTERRRLAHALARPDDLRQHALGNPEELEQICVPLALHDVEEQRPGGIGHVGHVLLAAGQAPDQPAIDGAEGQLAALGTRPRARHVVQNPAHLGCGKIRVEDEAGLCGDRFPSTTLLQKFTQRSCAPVLPDDCGMNRLARCALPHNDGLALVGDADGGDLPRPGDHARKDFRGAAHLARKNFRWIVLHPACLRIELLELLLRHGGNGAGLVEENRPRARRSLVQRQYVCHACLTSSGNQSNTRGWEGARRGLYPPHFLVRF